jgi:hypothetical protein
VEAAVAGLRGKRDRGLAHPLFMATFSFRHTPRFSVAFALATFAMLSCFGQTAGQSSNQQSNPANPAEPSDKRVLWIIPNFRTSPTLANYKPLTPKEKLKIATDDTFDRGDIVLAAAFAGEGELTKSNPSFGQEQLGYGRYFAAAYADLAIGNFMTEAVYPSILHQDPRYFRRGTGSGWSRLGYAVGQIFWTHTDSGRTQFNYSEIVGNSTAVAISTAYYPEGRDVGSAVSKLGSQIGVDMAANILKEFWPDLHRRLPGNH